MTAATEAPPLRRGLDLAQGWPYRLLVLFVCAIAAHLLLSPLGFNPTDDGFILAQSRRILAGEIPHRDFISIRPAGSAYLHVGELLAGGAHTFLLSRLVYWLEVAVACWCWLEIVARRARGQLGVFGTLPLAGVAFMLSAHVFPPMAWHTVDGILLASAGFLLAAAGSRQVALLGYVLLGGAGVCKQNFLPLAPLAILLLGDARKPSAWLAATALPTLYLAGLAAMGAARDFASQLRTITDLHGSGIQPYLGKPWLLGGAGLGALIGLACSPHARVSSRVAAAMPAAGAILGWTAIMLSTRRLAGPIHLYLDHDSLLLLGMVSGAVPVWLARGGSRPLGLAAMFAVALAWCSAISAGYRSPAHVAGPLAILLAFGSRAASDSHLPAASRVWHAGALLALFVVTPVWWSARMNNVYRERPAAELRHDLGGVLPGGRGIRTNAHTHAMLVELRDTVNGLGERPYAILVDAPAWWACAPQRNPLPSDWPQGIELHSLELQRRFDASLARHLGRGGAVVVQKADASLASERFVPIETDAGEYRAAIAVKAARQLESEGRYWAVYR